jgi:hypothetical protein
VAEDGTGHIFNVIASSVDLRQHVGHDVTLIGQRGSASAASPDAPDSSFAVTQLNMISEHCAVAAAVATALVTTPAETAVPPPAAAAPVSNTVAETEAVPAAGAAAPAAPAATVNTPAETAATPAVDAAPAQETNIAPAVDASAPAAPASTQAWDKSVADQTVPVHSRRRSATTAAVASAPDVTASEPAAAAASPAAPANPSPETAGTTDAAATTPAAPTGHGTALVLLIGFAVLVILIGVLVPSLSKWRKRKSLEETGAPNLSFTREASSDQEKTDKEEPRKAA